MQAKKKPSQDTQHKTLTDHTFDIIKGMILDHELLPGEQLNISALCKKLNVSSSPLREALVRLQGQRLLEQKIYRGFVIAEEPTKKYLNDVIDFRILVEGHAASVGIQKRDPKILEKMQEAYDLMSKTDVISQTYVEYREFIEADAAFHEAIVTGSQNQVLIESFSSLNVILNQSRLYYNIEPTRTRLHAVMDEHLQIIRAYEAGDVEAAKAAIESHLDGGRRRLLNEGDNPELID